MRKGFGLRSPNRRVEPGWGWFEWAPRRCGSPPSCRGQWGDAEEMEACRRGTPPWCQWLLLGGGGAPPGELGNHSHREGAMPPSRPQMSQPQTFIFIFIQLMKKVSRMQKELTSLLFKSCEICRHSHDYIPLTWLII